MRDTTEYQVSDAGCFSEIDAKAPSVASDARKACGCHQCTTEQEECSTGEVKWVADDIGLKDRTVDEIVAEDARSLVDSVSDLVQAYRDAVAELNLLKAKLRELSNA